MKKNGNSELNSQKIEISLAAADAGGRALAAYVSDPVLMAKENWAGEAAARVYRAMVAIQAC